MNIFRLLGDLSHLLAIIILLVKIWKTRSCAGESDRLDHIIQGMLVFVTSLINCDERMLIKAHLQQTVIIDVSTFTGISGKSQILFAIVYTTRYLDLFTTFISAYNTFMKIVFIAASLATVFLMYIKFKATYDHNHDTFR